MADHPLMEGLGLDEATLKMCVPFGVHGDEVPITGVGKVWSKSALTFQIFSLMAAASCLATKELMLWVWSVFEKLCVAGIGGTIDTFMHIFKWSWEALASGKWPEEDWRGVRLLSSFLFSCFQHHVDALLVQCYL